MSKKFWNIRNLRDIYLTLELYNYLVYVTLLPVTCYKTCKIIDYSRSCSLARSCLLKKRPPLSYQEVWRILATESISRISKHIFDHSEGGWEGQNISVPKVSRNELLEPLILWPVLIQINDKKKQENKVFERGSMKHANLYLKPCPQWGHLPLSYHFFFDRRIYK